MFAESFKQLRKSLKLNQLEISEVIGVAQSTVASWECGKRQPDIETIIRLSEQFGVSTDFLLGLSPMEVSVKHETPPPQGDDVVQLQFHLDDEIDESKLEKMVFDLVRKDFEKRGIEAAIRKVVNQEFEKRGL